MTRARSVSSPILLDLDGDGIETTATTAGAYFDHAGDGFAERTGWAGADDGLLVWDRNGNGSIDNGGELFGSETRLTLGADAGSKAFQGGVRTGRCNTTHSLMNPHMQGVIAVRSAHFV